MNRTRINRVANEVRRRLAQQRLAENPCGWIVRDPRSGRFLLVDRERLAWILNRAHATPFQDRGVADALAARWNAEVVDKNP